MRLKNKILVWSILGLLGTSWPAYAAMETFSTGKDWMEGMSPTEKIISLVPPMMLFRHYHVHLRRELPEYVSLIDKVLLRNPELKKEDVVNIFASTIHRYEPESRAALETMEMRFLRRHFGINYWGIPSLIENSDERDLTLR